MKNKFSNSYFKSILALIVVLLLSGCAEYFDNPLIDKETGKDINLLIIDFNFFTTSMTYKLLDAADNTQITKEAKINFSGQNGNDIVNFVGEKKGDYYTTHGQMELTIDPNVEVSENSPVEFAVHVEVDGYNKLAKGIQFQTEGKKTFELYLSKIEEEVQNESGGNVDYGNSDTTFHFFAPAQKFKSANIAGVEKEYKINYSVTISDLLLFKDDSDEFLFSSSQEIVDVFNRDTANFISLSTLKDTTHIPSIELINIDGKNRNVLYQNLETGSLVSLSFGGRFVDNLNGGKIRSVCEYKRNPNPPMYGFFKFENSALNLLGTEVIYEKLRFSYTVAKVIEDTVCEKGASFTFQSNMLSGFSIDADIFDMNENFITSINFKGNFPQKFEIESVPDMPVKVVFRNNNPAFKPIPSMEINSLCSGEKEIEVIKNEDYVAYQIIFKALCKDNPAIGIAPTYNVEFRLKNNEDDPWQGVTMAGGVMNVLGLPNQEYQMRLLWEGDWEYSSYFTEFDEDGSYLGKIEPDAKIESKILEDGRIQMDIEKLFSQSICNDLGW